MSQFEIDEGMNLRAFSVITGPKTEGNLQLREEIAAYIKVNGVFFKENETSGFEC